jgi:hypothetical protein
MRVRSACQAIGVDDESHYEILRSVLALHRGENERRYWGERCLGAGPECAVALTGKISNAGRIGVGHHQVEIAGVDKYFNKLADWSMYLNPIATRIVPLSATTFMHIVGIVEMAAGLMLLTRWTRMFAVSAVAADQSFNNVPVVDGQIDSVRAAAGGSTSASAEQS